MGASNLLCGLGGGWSGDSAAWRSNFSSSWFGRLWGGDPALSRRKDITGCASRVCRADGVSTLLHKCRLADSGAAQSRCDVGPAAVRWLYIYQCGETATPTARRRSVDSHPLTARKKMRARTNAATRGDNAAHRRRTPSPRRTHALRRRPAHRRTPPPPPRSSRPPRLRPRRAASIYPGAPRTRRRRRPLHPSAPRCCGASG